jgi:multicomponent Na+:H+ antiporter subunit E
MERVCGRPWRFAHRRSGVLHAAVDVGLRGGAGRRAVDRLSLWLWAFVVWLAMTWSVTAEQLTVGGLVALGAALLLAPLGGVVRPWRCLEPVRLGSALGLLGSAAVRIVGANVGLARRIWSPSLPLESGMVIVPTGMTSDGGHAGVGLITSVIVDNQIVDIDRSRCELLYHAVSVPDGTGTEAGEDINLPIERWLQRIGRGRA